jgi:anti-anti-sigma factor
MAEDGRILYARRGDTCILRFEGPIRYTIAHALDTFLDDLFASEPPHAVVADLSDAESIDSTGIGLLAKIAKCQRRAGFGNPVLFSSSPDINEVLCSVCLDDVFQLAEGKPDVQAGDSLSATEPSAPDLARSILEAHRALAELSDSNRAMFRDVIDGLSRELQA